ncbi:hypothetical protein PVAND_015001 [Polypedilum vanderplanki]|uniref:Uncharacterized protein n=1 Tax=Polypedilum vanderplanki TaxID=319348 RepID=A0A9J6BBM8_POLVA|nr:hypothetical protein PVAND_015001 [Polypedilum vanderplanki]
MRNFFINFLIILLFIRNSFEIAERLGCQDENGDMVDWFYLYKLPSKYSHISNSGLEYLYITPHSSSLSSWTKSIKLINSTESMPGRTLSIIYNKSHNHDLLFAMYNDEHPNGDVDTKRGHTKGVVVANDISGFWLVHSVPKFPPAADEEKYDYPHTGKIYGQSFLCISFTAEQIGIVGKQLQYNEPAFYSSQVPKYLEHIHPQVVEALKMKEIKSAPFYHIATLRSRHGTIFTSYAKSKAFNKELYEDFVAPNYLAGDFYVESWQHGRGNIKSDCTKPTKVYNIKDVSIHGSDFGNDDKIIFETLKDHSKWLVSKENNLTCIGDINRQEHQKVRGGGTVCLKNITISNIYTKSIESSEPCIKNQFKKYLPVKKTSKNIKLYFDILV